MAPAASAPVLTCPACGAAQRAAAERCWLCEAALIAAAAEGRRAAPPPAAPATSGYSFKLSTLMLVVTWCAVCFGLTAAMPGLGIALMIVSLPALVRTVLLARRSRRAGRPKSAAGKAFDFLGSVVVVSAIVGAVGVVAGLALMILVLAVCALRVPRSLEMPIVILIGAVGIYAVTWTAALVSILLWPRWWRRWLPRREEDR